MNKIPMTLEGYGRLQDELKRLKTTERPNIIKAIAEARDHGDLSENAEYHAARERQGFIEGRIMELEGKVGALQIIDPASVDSGGRIVFGATVLLEDLSSGDHVKYQIVGDDEADIKAGHISVSSPMARALIATSASAGTRLSTSIAAAIALSGLRSSWPSIARNSSFARLAASASMRAVRSAAVRRARSRCASFSSVTSTLTPTTCCGRRSAP